MKWLSFNKKSDTHAGMKIFLTDDHAILLDGLANLLSLEPEITVVGKAGTVSETLDKLTYSKVDILISDYNLPDGDGLSLVQIVKRKYPDIKILILSMHDEPHLVKEVLKEGVNGYMLKKDSHDQLIRALETIHSGHVFLSPEINAMLLRGLHQEEESLLTMREREILKLIAKEYTNRDIAEELFISERTVETHRKNIFRKTGTNNLVGLIKFAYANNLI